MACQSRDLVIDSGTGIAALRPLLPMMRAESVAVATHAHYDHVGGMDEFTTRLIHEAEAGDLGRADPMAVLLSHLFPPAIRPFLGSAAPKYLVTAAPRPDFAPASYLQARSEPTGCLDDGDVIDLGDRQLEVLHLPGHSPGSICLLDAGTQTLFSGDVVYAGGLIDEVWPGTGQGQQIIDRYLRRRTTP